MRYFTLIALTSISLSCQKNDKDHSTNDLLYSVDTVIIDSKGRLLDLDTYFNKSDLDAEESSIFLYNKFDHSIDEINLKNLEFMNNHPFEAEGPDGTGESVHYLNLLNDTSIFIKAFNGSAVFNQNGVLLKKIDWIKSVDSTGIKFGEIPQNEIAIGPSELKVFGLTYDNRNREVFLDVLSVKDNTVKRYDIDSKNSYHNFVLAIDDPKNYSFADPYVFLNSENNMVLVSHQYSNEIFMFNSEGEYVHTVEYETKMTPKRVKDLNGINITTWEQLREEYQHFSEQVRFGPPVWDSLNKQYLRLSAVRIFSDILKEDSMLPEIKEISVYLSVFDEEFNLVSELAIGELSSEYIKYFAKDGKLWVFQNFSDELGFIIIDI